MTRRNLIPRPCLGAFVLVLAQAATAQTAQDTTYRYQYDANGNLTQITDPLGRVTNQSYDALNRLTQQLQPAPVVGALRPAVKYSYNGRDYLTSVTDPRNLVTTYNVNDLGDPVMLISPDTGLTFFNYEAAGNLLSRTDAKGQKTSYSYDVLSRVTRIAFAGGNTIDYSYDQGPNGIGRLTQITDMSGTTQYAYDQKGRLVSETRTLGGVPYVTAYGYDGVGRLATLTYPSGRVVTYTRDAMGRISQIDVVKDNVSQTVVSQVSYRPFGGVQSFVNGAGQTISRGFDLNGRITSYSLRGQPQLVSYDAASRITGIWDTSNATNLNSYGYDDLDRLIQYTGTGPGQSFAYDAVGNRTGKSLGSGNTGYSYSPNANRLTQINGPTTSQTVAYDANGSITNNGANQFTYDARGRMVAANTVLGLVQYKINALGQRVQKLTPEGSTLFHYDQAGKLIGESTADGAFRKEYVYLNDIPVALLTP